MFTGLVQATGTVALAQQNDSGVRLLIEPKRWIHEPLTGESISVSGCCLTVAAIINRDVAFDVIPETLARTTLGRLHPGARVNLERSVRADELLGGHVVQGHVDGIARVARVRTEDEHRVTLAPPTALMPFIVPKGSVAVDGVSLTIADVDVAAGTFDVALIPTTLEATTLGALAPGHACNIETDILARTAVHWLRHYAPRQR